MPSKGKVTITQKKRPLDKKSTKTVVKSSVKKLDRKEVSNNSGEDSVSEEIEEDEVNIEDVSSVDESEDDEESADDEESEEEEGDDFPMKKKSKNSKHDDGSTDFSSAVNAILGSHLKAYDRKDPIMARNKKVLKQNESDKLEQQAKKELLVEKKKLLGKARKRDIIPIATAEDESGEQVRKVLEKEAKLRKIAQKGAVKLFNAILSTQVKTEKEVTTTLGNVRNKQERQELITEVSKEKFLDLVKAAGEEED